MSTLADELLQDFEDSGSETGDKVEDDGDDNTAALMGLHGGDVEMGGDDLSSDEGDEEMGGMARDEDPEETKAKVDKIDLGGVSDVRSVASLIKALEPVLEVSTPSSLPPPPTAPPPWPPLALVLGMKRLHLSTGAIALTAWTLSCRKSRSTSHNRPNRGPTTRATSRTTQSTTS